MCVVKRDGKVVIIDQTKRITELEATLIDCRAEYLLLLDENPNTFAWDFDELPREDQNRYRKDARDGLQIEEPIISIQLREAEAQVAALKKIVIKERFWTHWKTLPFDSVDDCTDYTRRQLAKEYPEIFGD